MHHQRDTRKVGSFDLEFIRHIGRNDRRHTLVLAEGPQRRAEQLRRGIGLHENEAPGTRVEPRRHGGDHRRSIAHGAAHQRIYLLRSVSPASVSSLSRT